MVRRSVKDSEGEKEQRIHPRQYEDAELYGSKMRSIYADKQEPVPDKVDERTRLRENILKMSLFPNLYNRSNLLSQG